MKFLLLCRQECDDLSNIKIVKMYTEEDRVPQACVEETLLGHISHDLGEGTKQQNIANQTNKTLEEIAADENLPYNHYIRFENGAWYLYEKYKEETEISEGWVFSTTKKVVTPCIKKVAMFTIVT